MIDAVADEDAETEQRENEADGHCPDEEVHRGGSGDLGDGRDPADAAEQRALADPGLAPVVPEQVENVAELVMREESLDQRVQLDGALRQGPVGEDRGVKVAVEPAPAVEWPEVGAASGPSGARATTPAMSVVGAVWVRSGANDSHSRTAGSSNRSGAPSRAGERRSSRAAEPGRLPRDDDPRHRAAHGVEADAGQLGEGHRFRLRSRAEPHQPGEGALAGQPGCQQRARRDRARRREVSRGGARRRSGSRRRSPPRRAARPAARGIPRSTGRCAPRPRPKTPDGKATAAQSSGTTAPRVSRSG